MILVLAFAIGMMPVSIATEASLDNFQKVNTYGEGQFSDVAENTWYASGVKTAFEYDLMKGNNNGFNPSGNITYAELIAIASRLHNIYNGGDGNFVQGNNWYQVYVDYATKNSLIDPNSFYIKDEYMNAPSNRADFAVIIAKTIAVKDLKAINNITAIPYITPDTSGSSEIFLLYNAGILTGSDEYGDLGMYDRITRSEVATIIGRVINEKERIHFSLPPVPVYGISPADIYALLGEVELIIGETVNYKINFWPDNPSDRTLIWTSSTPSIASVDSNGNITANKEGIATITATAKYGYSADGVSTAIKVRVRSPSSSVQSESKKMKFTYESVKELAEKYVKAAEAATEMSNNILSASDNPFSSEYVYIYCIDAQRCAYEVLLHLTSIIQHLEKHESLDLENGQTFLEYAYEIYYLFEDVTKIKITNYNSISKLVDFSNAAFDAFSSLRHFGDLVLKLSDMVE